MTNIDLTAATEAAARAVHGRGHFDTAEQAEDYRSDASAALSAALPHIEQQIREQVAQEIETSHVLVSSWWADGRDNYVDKARALRNDLARLARGGERGE